MEQPLVQVLKKHGLRHTDCRRAVYIALVRTKAPFTMRELYESVREVCDRASVYRTATLFEDIGVVRRINIGWKYKLELGDTFVAHHHHLVCIKCDRVIPISEDNLEIFVRKLANNHKFIPTNHYFEVQGICEECQGQVATAIDSECYRTALNPMLGPMLSVGLLR